MTDENKKIVEAALFAAAEPLSAERLLQLFDGRSHMTVQDIHALIEVLKVDYQDRGVQLQEVASGYRFQARIEFAPWLQRLWEKKPIRYTRALLETLALIAYRQPITRGEIEEIRGVAVSVEVIKKLQERNWIKVVGARDLPGKPSMFGTTKEFLDYFNLKNLSDLPPLQDIIDIEKIERTLSEQLAFAPKALEPTETSETGAEANEISPDLNEDTVAAMG